MSRHGHRHSKRRPSQLEEKTGWPVVLRSQRNSGAWRCTAIDPERGENAKMQHLASLGRKLLVCLSCSFHFPRVLRLIMAPARS